MVMENFIGLIVEHIEGTGLMESNMEEVSIEEALVKKEKGNG